MNDHVHDLASVRDATDRLLTAAARLDNADLAGPSRLPGWTRGHVLAHLSRNADALVNVLAGRPMYESETARDEDIERDAPRGAAEQLADLRASALRLEEQAALTTDWSRTVELRNGITDSASGVPFRRLIEVELHHVDLDAGYELEDLPGAFVERETGFLTARFEGHPEVVPVRITADGRSWTTGGGAGGGTVEVSGTAAEVMGWLAGRRDGTALAVTGGTLPPLPPL
ncbi:maleylpyruvate isomerase family mycothiol-dependent enzyme [Streptomyces sp. NPDC058045]|uniref:maleylpyruvate isomerase family mycothiol-dependent enzyme n=1 Tax=Streptomyces sp. NPDC058045 TaxID=3346311 RepID=UPI0036E62501